MSANIRRRGIASAVIVFLMGTVVLPGQIPVGSAFTYQGRLTDGGAPASGVYDLEFQLFDASAGGSQIGSTQLKDDVSVAEGFFTVTLDFGAAAFAGNARWLSIGVRPGVEHRSVHDVERAPGAQALRPTRSSARRCPGRESAANRRASRTTPTTTAAATSRASRPVPV